MERELTGQAAGKKVGNGGVVYLTTILDYDYYNASQT